MAVTTTFTVFELNDTIDLGNSTDNLNDTEETFCAEDEGIGLQTIRVVFKPLLYSLIFLLGMAGNGLMMTVLLRRWRLLRITEIYLMHLALADLMLLITFPIDIVDSIKGWLFGEFLCRLTGLMRNLNLHCGCFLLACIGFDRYLAIVHAIPSMQSRRPRTVHQTCILLWLVCFGLSIPNVVFLSVEDTHAHRLSCSYHLHGINANNWVLASRVFDHVCFFLPLAVMSYCYTAVVVTLRSSQRSHAKKGAIRLALLVTLAFFYCWLPYNITLLIKTMVDLKLIETCELSVQLLSALDVTKGLGFSHCYLNPFLYAFVGVRFRKDLIQLLYKLGCSRVCLPFIRAQGHSRPSISDGATTSSTILI
ncbi:C-X-C chemokine receptor type 5 [Plectropomus leopardus]|uniref:C-X-C chemokine receptor type 5 n=1 Tax=Plectropomus leopardus TaxID=160734 RepID=UPI001C4B32C5|nr:C-X-C chemokine receptor type 5 [Plectropomus leopardus]